ncbi:2463_t:CDS:2, partial [Cetraspora pellucida]
LAKGHGYFSLHTRNIKIAHGKKTLTGQLPINVEISVPTSLNPWLKSCFLVTGFDSKNFNKNQVIKSKLNDLSETCLSVEVFQYSLDEIQNEIKNLTMRWCIIDTHKRDEKDHITVDVGSKPLSLSFFDVLASNVILREYSSAKFGGPAAAAGQTLSAVETVGDAITPFVPLFNMVTNILTQMLSIYDNAKCNEKICLALLDRVEIAQTAVKSLQRKYQANEKNFRDQVYYDAWIRFVNVLENIRKFSKEVTQLNYFQKVINANAVKDAFEKNIKEFEEVCSDLKFTIVMYNAEQREMEAKNVAEDFEILKKSMNEMKDEIKAEIRLAITEVTTLMSSANYLGSLLSFAQQRDGEIPVVDKTALLIEEYKAPRVDASELSEPFASNDNVRGSNKTVHKKIFRGIEVACKKVKFYIAGESGQTWEDEPSARPSDIEMQQKLKALFNENLFSEGISPQIHPKKTDSGDIPILEFPRNFQVCITDSQPSDLFKAPDELD